MMRTIAPQIWSSRGRAAAVAAAMLFVAVTSAGASAATGWTGPAVVGPPANCSSVSAAIDTGGSFHVAAACSNRVCYSQFADTPARTATTFANPGTTFDLGPQVAIDGSRIYIASTRYAPTD